MGDYYRYFVDLDFTGKEDREERARNFSRAFLGSTHVRGVLSESAYGPGSSEADLVVRALNDPTTLLYAPVCEATLYWKPDDCPLETARLICPECRTEIDDDGWEEVMGAYLSGWGDFTGTCGQCMAKRVYDVDGSVPRPVIITFNWFWNPENLEVCLREMRAEYPFRIGSYVQKI
jgi:hypothetical protein